MSNGRPVAGDAVEMRKPPSAVARAGLTASTMITCLTLPVAAAASHLCLLVHSCKHVIIQQLCDVCARCHGVCPRAGVIASAVAAVVAAVQQAAGAAAAVAVAATAAPPCVDSHIDSNWIASASAARNTCSSVPVGGPVGGAAGRTASNG